MKGMITRFLLIAARLAGSVLQLLLTVALTRTADPSTAAAALVQFSWVQLAAAAIAWGHPVTILRDAAPAYLRGDKYKLSPHMRGVAFAAIVVVVVGGAIAALVMRIDLTLVALVALAALVHATVRMFASALRSYQRELLATLVEFTVMPVVLLIATLLTAWVFPFAMTEALFAAAQAGAALLALVTAAIAWWLTKTPAAQTDADLNRVARRGSVHFIGLNQLLTIGAAQLPVVMAPFVLDAHSTAAFVVIFRIASMSTTVVTALVGYYSPRFARAYARGNRHRMRRLMVSSQVFSCVVCAPLILVIPWTDWLLSLFGDGYGFAVSSYIILAVGQYISIATGLKAQVLSLGHRERSLTVLNLTMLVALVLSILAISLFSTVNLVSYSIALAAYFVVRALALYVMTRRFIASVRPVEQSDSPPPEKSHV